MPEIDILRSILTLCAASCAAFALISAVPAIACQNSNIVQGPATILNEDFHFVDDAWGRSDNVRIGAGRATVTPAQAAGQAVIYFNAGFGDIDACLAVETPAGFDRAATPVAAAGLIFWAQDALNHYSVQINANRTVSVQQLVANRWNPVISHRPVEGLRLEPGQINTLRVVLEANTAIIFVNNERFAGIRGQLQEGVRGKVGVYAQSDSTKSTTWAFTGLKVTNVAAPRP
jgi:hypothetical protein